MKYEVQVAPAAASQIKVMNRRTARALLNLLRNALGERLHEIGVALRGALRDYRAIVKPVTYQVIYRINDDKATVQVLKVEPLPVALYGRS